eukprot:CAMPEP_0172563672 /NCGR_PEP_ID=MMETSP1067-20121228/101477_1 /TAXON_ID=265564 ORGANISM="Thalassiosira punctigera, Strain Tpunct2005C2" /NCGR_SAMPLE_ID=MMETSP1067 /ASSEMBLY_ACC=CAM_ASM_000444 /LENGTH=81 /DNA_ID=CAMNT_0013354165 /DNA_START=63 /DNA_END=309 /DNA_ORIENTATION=+
MATKQANAPGQSSILTSTKRSSLWSKQGQGTVASGDIVDDVIQMVEGEDLTNVGPPIAHRGQPQTHTAYDSGSAPSNDWAM